MSCRLPFTGFLPRMRFAFALIWAADDGESLPAFTICVARALAFAAFNEPGRALDNAANRADRIDFSPACRAESMIIQP